MVWRTTFITISTCFLLGTTFTHWIADHDVLWRTPLTQDAVRTSLEYYSLLSAAPGYLSWVYVGIVVLALGSAGGRSLKGWREDQGAVVFDGASVVLLASITYTQMSKVFPTITLIPSPLPPKATLPDHPLYPGLVTAVTDLASDNVITAVMLTGVMLLQAGRYYSKRPTKRPSPSPPASPIAARAQTPFRELSEEEALELQE